MAYGLILPPPVLALPRLGCLNIHGSLLPRWRGAAPIQRAMLAGDTETGVTIMQLDAGLDTGPMLLERRQADRLAGHRRRSARRAVRARRGCAARSHRRNRSRHAQAARTAGGRRELRAEDRKIRSPDRLAVSAMHLDRKIRAFNPWPVAETRFAGETLRVLQARIAERHRRSRRAGHLVRHRG